MDEHLQALREWILQELDDAKAVDVLELDIRALTQIADWMVVASGTSTRHVLALAERLREAGVKHGQKPTGVEGDNEGEWVLMDFGDLIVHLMLPATREFYDLEGLWNERLGIRVSQAREQVEG
ncbi:MAG: ribosome silencing factor [Gammaproteobacteria bacterium]|nr:ribosome silencing factor [Gammaproteobacteria bacterium]NDA13819.1 ribosome silencing factor [Gammaproteobacteria bacterium]NDG43452.1 ribosome silencing factor [Gammaproteobacteria bacterium]